MGRLLRPALPGAPFHITARTQWQEPLFEGMEMEVAELIRGSIDRSDAELVAYAVMSNHIHVVVVQGRRPLSAYMQPLLRRIALLVVRRRGRAGHVFAGRYCHRVCQDPDYFRSIVAYVHLNPVRAGLCRTADDYEWTSHRDYARGTKEGVAARYQLAIEQGLRVFAQQSEQSLSRCRHDYRRFIRWRQQMDRYLSAETHAWHPLPRPLLSIGGDRHWHREYGTTRTVEIAGGPAPPVRLRDLRDHVADSLRDLAPGLTLDLLRNGGCSRPLVRVRTRVIARAVTAGYRGSRLAEFLNVSPATVSRVRAMLREGAQL